MQRSYEQVIDETQQDERHRRRLLEGRDRPRRARPSSRSGAFIEEHQDEITALQVLYSRPYARAADASREIKELADAIERPPHRWTPERLWEAYETLDASKVRGSAAAVLTDLVSLVRFALGEDDELVPFPEQVRERFEAWLLQQENAGRDVHATSSSRWLELIRDHLAASLGDRRATTSSYTPFAERGGLGKARRGVRRRPRRRCSTS